MTYEYKFTDTEEIVEADSYGLTEIDGRPVKRIFSSTAFTLKGSGWHKSDYPSGKNTRLHVQEGLNYKGE